MGSLLLKKNLHVEEPLSIALKVFSTYPHPQLHALKYQIFSIWPSLFHKVHSVKLSNVIKTVKEWPTWRIHLHSKFTLSTPQQASKTRWNLMWADGRRKLEDERWWGQWACRNNPGKRLWRRVETVGSNSQSLVNPQSCKDWLDLILVERKMPQW